MLMRSDDRSRCLLDLVHRDRPQWLQRGRSLERKQVLRTQESIGATPIAADALVTLTDRLSPELPASALTPGEVDTLEAIVHTELRPALLVQDGTFLPPPAEWQQLVTYRAGIDHAIERTCRIETEGGIDLDWVGTGFVVAPDLVATNRHVVQEFASYEPNRGWRIRDGVSVRADFRQEIGSTAVADVPVTGIWGVHNRFDIAILQMRPGLCPSPIPAGLPNLAAQRDVVVIGYPAYDSRRNDAAVMDRIFRGIYNVKRVQPGRIILRDNANYLLRHDSSTLGGNSGSPVIDLQSGRLIGIHFRGHYLRWNDAVDIS
jgi:glutamyl endopeptidase